MLSNSQLVTICEIRVACKALGKCNIKKDTFEGLLTKQIIIFVTRRYVKTQKILNGEEENLGS